MFLVGYIAFQLPGTLLVRKLGAPNQFAMAMILVRLDISMFMNIHTD